MQILRFKWVWEPFPHLTCENGSECGIGMDCPALRLTQIRVSHPELLGTYMYIYSYKQASMKKLSVLSVNCECTYIVMYVDTKYRGFFGTEWLLIIR